MTGLVLHDYFRSSTSIRLRAALNLKGLSYDQIAHHLRKGEHRDAAYLAINPQGLVPALVLEDGAVLTQSLAIIEYLEETHPEPALLPRDAAARAHGDELDCADGGTPSRLSEDWPDPERLRLHLRDGARTR